MKNTETTDRNNINEYKLPTKIKSTEIMPNLKQKENIQTKQANFNIKVKNPNIRIK